jgi:diacylglycerol O-acyltransferase / wax synthase
MATSTARRERLTAVDTAWLRMDRPENLMMICGVLIFRERLSAAKLRKVLQERFVAFTRFMDRPVQGIAGNYWEAAPDFDLDDHLVVTSLPGARDTAELQDFVSTLMATALPPEHPRWQFHLITDYDGGSALVVRIHHSYADGIALVRVMLSMTDAGPDGPPAMPFAAHERRTEESDGSADADDPLAQLMRPVGNVLEAARKLGSRLIETGAGIWEEPARAVALAGQGTALTAEVAKLALMGQDSATRFKGAVGVAKRVAWAAPLPLDEVKAVGRALGASVNDVLLACVAGALRDYLAEHGDMVDGVRIRALVPVNLRPMEEAYRLGNRFGLVFLELPLGIANPVERLYAVRANMRALKDSYQPLLALGLLAAMGAGPRVLQEALLVTLARNATAVMTNVPGPQQPLYLAGSAIDSLMFWVPQSGDIGMGVSIISYHGNVQFGLVTDARLCPDPERIVERFGYEFEKLLMTTLLSPWPEEGDLDPAVAEAAVSA